MTQTSAARAALIARIAAAELVTTDAMIASDTAGIELFVRNKRPAGLTRFAPARTLLMVHGSTYPAETAFDLRLAGLSMMEAVAAEGFDVWLVDVRGYGRSTRPPEMHAPAAANAPIVRTGTAVRDVGAAVDHIRAVRGLERLNLLGWSWGTTLMGAFSAAHPDIVAKLVLLAPQWLRTTPSLSDQGGPLGAYRTVSVADARARWLRGVPADRQAAVLPAGWFEAWAAATLATDPWGASQDPPVVRAPNGTVQDSRDFWGAGVPVYDPGRIACPVLVVHGEWDQDLPLDMARAYFALLTGSPYRRWVEIAEGTHSLLMEANRLQLFAAITSFLGEDFAPETAA